MNGQDPTGLLWVEKYRPTTLEGMALEDETRRNLTMYLAQGEIPHLLFAGPPGSGKTTAARILLGALDCQVLSLNASAERGIDTVRGKIGGFVQAMTLSRWQIVFLDEADAMTADAQTALRNLIESYADRARFILTANNGHKIIGPIQSRCQLLSFGAPPLKERYRILADILQREGITAPNPSVTLSYAERFPDLRRAINAVQRAWLASAGTLPPAVSAEKDGKDLLGMVTGKNWTGLRHLTSAGDFDTATALRAIFHAIPDEHPKAGFLRHIIGRGVHETGFTPDPVILFLAVCAEAMEGL